jgi:hypothetical protein
MEQHEKKNTGTMNTGRGLKDSFPGNSPQIHFMSRACTAVLPANADLPQILGKSILPALRVYLSLNRRAIE